MITRRILQVLSAVALVAVIAAPVAYLAGSLEKAPMMTWMLGSTVLWFATVPFWMERKA